MLLSRVRTCILLLCVTLVAQAAASLAFGQASSTAGAIGGTVVDQSGAVISGASVSARNVNTGLERSGKTEDNGQFRFSTLPVGSYEVTANAQGFAQLKQTGITVRVGDVIDLKLEMKPSGASEVVSVTAEAPIAEPSKTEVATTINEKVIEELPVNGRRWSNFVALTPGVTMDGSFGLISFRGISGLLNNNTVDGSDNNQAFFSEERGRTRISYVISQESIREFQVNTQNYSAEFGRAAGGVVNAVTKSGTNDIHGSAFYYIRDTALNARNPLNFVTVGFNPDGSPIRQAINPPDRRQQFGGTMGGPIKKDHAFWFFSYDQQKRNFPMNSQPDSPRFFSDCSVPLSPLVPASPAACDAATASLLPETGISPRKGDQWIVLPKVDWQVTKNNLFTASYNHLHWDSPNGIQTQPVVSFAQSGNGADKVLADILNFRLVSTLRSTMLNEARFSYGRDFEFEPANAPDRVGASIGGFQVGPPTFLPRAKFPDERKVELVDNFTIVHGAHALKFGGDMMRATDDLDSLFTGFGQYSYGTRNNRSAVANFGTDLVTPGARNYNTYTQSFGPSKLKFHTWDLSAYIQDEWKVRQNITVNLGLRYEVETMPDTILVNTLIPQTAELHRDTNNFGPRVGFAWDIFNNRKTVLRAGYGIYYGRIINSAINNALINTGAPGSVVTLTFTPTTAGAPVFPNRFSSIPTGASAPKPDVFFFDPHLEAPMIHEADVVLEREITPSMSVSAAYLMSRGRKLPFFFDTNLPIASRAQDFLILDSSGAVSGHVSASIFVNPRLNSSFRNMIAQRSIVDSSYDAFVIKVNRRFSHGLQFLAHFTYSRATDTNQRSQTFSANFPTALNQFDLEGERGRSSFDVPRRFVASAIWDVPFLRDSSNTFAKSVLVGWKLNPIVTIQDGFRVAESVSGNLFSFTDPDGFAVAATANSLNGSGGSNRVPFEPRNKFQLPPLYNVDVRLAKEFHLKDRYRIEFIAEAFNLFNHTLVFGATSNQFDLVKVKPDGTPCPSTGACSPALPAFRPRNDFLTPTADQSTLYRERQIQLALRFRF